MSKAWLQLGKTGDILNVLPILSAEFHRTCEKQNLIVSKEFSSVACGLNYVNPVIYDGSWSDYQGAYQFGKFELGRVVPLQMHGEDMKFARQCPSVFLDMWKRGGALKHYDEWPLELPFQKQPSSKSIFYADHSESSPFPYREQLYRLLLDTFPNRNIVRSSSVRMKNIRDFMPMMDASELIVSVDTSFLHLSRAVETPVIALVTSRPDPWRATPWSKRFAFHCRYDAFDFRKPELVAAMNIAVNKKRIATPEIQPAMRPFAYNMAMFEDVNKVRHHVYRYHTQGWKTRLAIDNGVECWDVQFPSELDNDSLEDARCFHLNGKLHIAYTVSRSEMGQFRCIQAYGPLEFDGQWRVAKHIVPNVTGNDFSGMQKNYCPIVAGGNLYFIYGIKGANQVIHQVIGDKVVASHEMPAPTWKWGEIRGGCVLPYKGQLIRFFHSRVGGGAHYKFRYYVGAAIMEPEPPFRTQMVSSFPIFAGDERYVECGHWKPNCNLVYGALPDGDGFLISGGINDSMCYTSKLDWKDLNL